MTAGTQNRRQGRLISLHEEVRSSSGLHVDRDAGVIRNVKILGYESKNGRRYTAEAMKRAINLYEGVRCNIDHPHVLGKEKPDAPRSSYDRFGRLINVRYVEGQGLFGDLEYLKSHPMAPRVMEAAERMPDLFGLSHNAEGKGDTENGVFVVHEIVELRHVDLVPDAATNQSLAESYDPMSWETELLQKANASPRLTAKSKRILQTVLEQEGTHDEGADDHRGHILKAIHSLLTSEEDEDAHEKINGLMKIINPKPKDEEEEEEEEEYSAGRPHMSEEEDEERKKTIETDMERGGHVGEEAEQGTEPNAPTNVAPGLRKGPDKMPATGKDRAEFRPTPGDPLEEQVKVLKLEKDVRRLCESAGVQIDENLIEALASTKDKTKIKTCIESLKKTQRVGHLPRPRSQGPGPQPSNRLNRENFIRELKKGR
jgi:hypothetical protein